MEPGEAKSKPRKGRLTTFGRVVAGIFTVALVWWMADYFSDMNLRSLGLQTGEWPKFPRYINTTSQVTLTFDGEEVVIEGTTRCERNAALKADGSLRWWQIDVFYFGPSYSCTRRWFAKRLNDGSALLVGAYDRLNPSSEGLRVVAPGSGRNWHFDPKVWAAQIRKVPPTVIWIDNAEAPTRAEYYYSPEALRDPTSRLTALHSEVEMTAAGLLSESFSNSSETATAEQLPWLSVLRRQDLFIGYYAIEIPRERWLPVPGLLEEVGGFDSATVFFRSLSWLPERVANPLKDYQRWIPPRQVRRHIDPATMMQRQQLPGQEPRSPLTNPGFITYRFEVESNVFRLERSAARGVLHLSLRAPGRSADAGEIRLDGVSVPITIGEFGNSSLLFDPKSESLYLLKSILLPQSLLR